MVKSFADDDTALLWDTGKTRRIPANLRRVAWRKLALLDAAVEMDNLKIPPNPHLEALLKKRKGQHSIRVNLQYRVCFVWKDGNAYEVEIVDYHDE